MTDMLWETSVLLQAMNARPIGVPPSGITGISIDTRTLEPGDAFFAIRGERFDGHDFLTAATKAGAALHVVAEQKLPALGRVQSPILVVDDVLQALSRLAEASRARSKAQIVAVTGSVGKTTTKEALRHGLSAVGTVHASAASFNNHWGVPLSLARLPADARYAVFEIGMNHPGEIRPLVKLVRPHVAIVTLIAPAHLGHFRDLDEIAEAKAEIFEGLVPGGTALLNADDPQCGPLATFARKAGVTEIATFGEATGADFRLLNFAPQSGGAEVEAEIAGEPVRFTLASPGRHMAQNCLAVLGAAHRIGADVHAVAAALSSWRAVKGRGARYRLAMPGGGTVELIDDSYNANPASMRAAIEVLAGAETGEGGRRIAVLGDMLELGRHAPELHAALAEPLGSAGIDMVFLAGEEMKALDDVLAGGVACEWHETNDELLAALLKTMRAGDVVMMKASKSIGFAPLIERVLSKYPPHAADAALSTPSNADAPGAA
ncbi:UDP-N-acetylmuramoylalanyl-D-glutamyl-2,6-diaminopimelate--D-alanyl-D-alanine ligase [Aurantimonas sp. VKM B-3413]|uniref:UDP-N-acetylmuramoylalanyl-D-glutamyl-2, 6-diaminopimelate--D-alanyl-D-alanine ligase n=1 Tax=Aurantimonas sp. VKM B-3413 TaxID=2779401 RepID=UPI001E596F8F|nr:UDP-N-acetylmuramoylalanyl-D-glutamyl-2,6-diaminopimelate--D-alanyl-D-alanine ligase [Aurantimonas sp. VKM B-3413]MCB8837869.1 UDP-N-acetylmuramoylalanyl-D-glutamyl-2,6-diaminopimelate--D-alanyl-D-alanine ligase [Aurantimonas sp. VKM B-3413]